MYKIHPPTAKRPRIWCNLLLICGGILCQLAQGGTQAQAQVLPGNMRSPEGPEINFRSPTGFVCDYKSADLPYFTVYGGTISRKAETSKPNRGYYSYGGSLNGGPTDEMTAGVALVMPLGGNSTDNCQKFIDHELSQSKLDGAKMMMVDGLITEEQFKVIVEKHYQSLLE